eukprot:2924192-Rhodomonas_salina.2
MEMRGAEGVQALASAITQGHTPNLEELDLVSVWKGCDGGDDGVLTIGRQRKKMLEGLAG